MIWAAGRLPGRALAMRPEPGRAEEPADPRGGRRRRVARRKTSGGRRPGGDRHRAADVVPWRSPRVFTGNAPAPAERLRFPSGGTPRERDIDCGRGAGYVLRSRSAPDLPGDYDRELNEEQRRSFWPGRPILVIAGAGSARPARWSIGWRGGSGRAWTLSRILLLTFTNKAARNARRVEAAHGGHPPPDGRHVTRRQRPCGDWDGSASRRTSPSSTRRTAARCWTPRSRTRRFP